MDTKKFQRATEIMNELKRLHESLENLKDANTLAFSISKRSNTIEEFYAISQTFIACKEIAISEMKKRIAQLEKRV